MHIELMVQAIVTGYFKVLLFHLSERHPVKIGGAMPEI